MPASVVPVIYDHITRKVMRWYVLDHEGQLKDHAFGPQSIGERVLKIPMPVYRSFGKVPVSGNIVPALAALQNYVDAHAP